MKAKEKVGHGAWEGLFDGSNRKSEGPKNFRFKFLVGSQIRAWGMSLAYPSGKVAVSGGTLRRAVRDAKKGGS